MSTTTTSGPAHRVSSAVEEFGFPNGHLGHLSAAQSQALTQFRTLCEDKGIYKPGNGSHIPPSHDDATLLRFLRARRFSVQEAFRQFKDTEDWRKANEITNLYETIDLEQYDETRRLYPQWTGRRDRRGIPVYVFEVKHLNSKRMAAYDKAAAATASKAKGDGTVSPKLVRLFALYENLIRFVMPVSTFMSDRDYPRTPITQSNNIVDISGVGLKQFWNLRGHMQDASTLATAHYPETLDRIFIIGAPSFFPTVWGWVKRWFDPITVSKIFILSAGEVQKTLTSFIDPANIPKKYGGQLDFAFGDMPVLDPALKKAITWEPGFTDFPHGPMYWEDAEDGTKAHLIAVGSVKGKQRKDRVCTVLKGAKIATADEKQEDAETVKGGGLTVGHPLERVPTAQEYVDSAARGNDATEGDERAPEDWESPRTSDEEASQAVQNGEVVPAARPEPVSFVTASDGIDSLNKLTLQDKKEVGAAAASNGHPNGQATATSADAAPEITVSEPLSKKSSESSRGGKLKEKLTDVKEKVKEKVSGA